MPTLLRLATAGSVDDGKSTLIGRLLYDTKSIFEDQLEAVEHGARQLGVLGVEVPCQRLDQLRDLDPHLALRHLSQHPRITLALDQRGQHRRYRDDEQDELGESERAVGLRIGPIAGSDHRVDRVVAAGHRHQ